MSKKEKNKRALEKRYGVSEGRYYRAGQNYTNAPTPKDFDERLAKKANNDYDTRKQQETFDLALRDEEFRSGLDKKTREFVENYNKGKDHHKGMSGIDSYSDVQTLNQFGKLWHKHESGNGGKFTSVNDYAGATSHMADRMRKFHDRNFLTKDDQLELPQDDQQTPDSLLPDDYTPSPQLQRAQDLVRQYENGVLQSQSGEVPSASLGEIATNEGLASDSAEASDATSRAQSFLDNHTLNLKQGFQKYGINTRGENSTASRNDQLMQGLG